jgi:hypothetical protein
VKHVKLLSPGGYVSELVMNLGGLGVLEMVLVRPDWVRRSNPRMCLGPYSAEAMETFQELMVSMTVLHAERPAYFTLDMAQMGRAWSEERERSWEGFTQLEQVREAGRRYDVVHAMRDQYAWRSCVLCRGYIEDVHEIHLARPCGHQTHESCFRQWSAATATLMGGTLCPQGCGHQMTIFEVESDQLLMPAISSPFGAGGAGGVGNLMYPEGGPAPALESWMPQVWVGGRPRMFPQPMTVAREGYRPHWN